MSIFTTRYRVYWSETDAAIMMHFSNFFRACERAEEDFWESMGLRFDPSYGIIFPRVHASCDYTSPLRPGDWFRVVISRVILGRSSITYFFEIFREKSGELAARCKIIAAAYSVKEGRAVPIPEPIRRLLLERGAEERK